MLECHNLDPGPLRVKGIARITDCRPMGYNKQIKSLFDAYSFVKDALIALGMSSRVEFTENENIGDKFMIYKFSVFDEKSRIASIRLVICEYTPIRLIIIISSKVEES